MGQANGPPLLAFRKVDLPAREATFEELVADIKRAAGGIYMLGLGLDALKEESAAGGAVTLADLIRRRCDALQRLVEQPDAGEGRADG